MTAIIKRELVSFFKNPIGYFVFGIYAFLSAFFFTLTVLWNNTSYLGNYFGSWIFFVYMIVVSILSMRFFSEEKKNKTDQLLLTSKISIYALVAGKFLGALIMMIIFSSVHIIYIGVVDYFGTVDYGSLFSNIVGSLLIISAILSIGLFVSSLTESSIGAALGTLAVLGLLYGIDFLAIFMPTFIARIIMLTNIYAYYGDFTDGIINLPNVVYYLSIICIFLFLTVRVIEKRRWS